MLAIKRKTRGQNPSKPRLFPTHRYSDNRKIRRVKHPDPSRQSLQPERSSTINCEMECDGKETSHMENNGPEPVRLRREPIRSPQHRVQPDERRRNLQGLRYLRGQHIPVMVRCKSMVRPPPHDPRPLPLRRNIRKRRQDRQDNVKTRRGVRHRTNEGRLCNAGKRKFSSKFIQLFGMQKRKTKPCPDQRTLDKKLETMQTTQRRLTDARTKRTHQACKTSPHKRIPRGKRTNLFNPIHVWSHKRKDSRQFHQRLLQVRTRRCTYTDNNPVQRHQRANPISMRVH